MFFERFKTPGLAHNAYLLASKKVGILVDPRRDIEEYVKKAQSEGITIKYVLETHRQEDFVLGSKSIKNEMEAKIIGGMHELFSYCDVRLADGEIFTIEELTIKALHTPGHTPESMSYAIFQKGKKDCWCVFTGDALFIGETGRTDLPNKDKTGENAGILFDAINEKILPLGPQTILYPAHGSGSVCGGNIAEYDESTLGFEQSYNPVFKLNKDEFIKKKLHERLPRPPYFNEMEKMNLYGGKPISKTIDSIKIMSAEEFMKNANDGIIIDTRLPEAYAGVHIKGSFSVWLEGLPVFGGYLANRDTPIYLVLERADDLKKAYQYLLRIGMENIKGVLTENFEQWRNKGFPILSSGIISPSELKFKRENFLVLDVREVTEYEDDGHIEGAINCFVGDIGKYLKDFSTDKPIVVTCSVGHRANLAVSMLEMAGHVEVFNMIGGMNAWKKLNFPMIKGKDESFYYMAKNKKPEYYQDHLH